MAYFNRNDRGGGRDFNRDSRDRGSFSRGPRRPSQMFHAVCSKCGQDCEVPFRPSSDKPVYCSNCFDRDQTPRRENFGDRNDSRTSFKSERPSFRSEGPRESFSAVCANCGKDCTLPFQPRTNKPVYCSDCFDKNGGDTRKREQTQSQPQNTKQLDAIIAKLNQILELLGAEIEVEPTFKHEVEMKKQNQDSDVADAPLNDNSNEPEVEMVEEEITETSPEEVEVVTEIKPKKVRKSSKKSTDAK